MAENWLETTSQLSVMRVDLSFQANIAQTSGSTWKGKRFTNVHVNYITCATLIFIRNSIVLSNGSSERPQVEVDKFILKHTRVAWHDTVLWTSKVCFPQDFKKAIASHCKHRTFVNLQKQREVEFHWSSFQTTVQSPTNHNRIAMNQSEFLAITFKLLEAREKSRVRGALGFGFASNWLKKRAREF